MIQQKCEEKLQVKENKPEKFSSRAYVRRRLIEMKLDKALPEKGFSSLTGCTMIAINKEILVFTTTKKRNEHFNQEQLEMIQETLINDTKKSTRDGTFQLLKYTDSQNSRWYSLLPIYPTVGKHISIDS